MTRKTAQKSYHKFIFIVLIFIASFITGIRYFIDFSKLQNHTFVRTMQNNIRTYLIPPTPTITPMPTPTPRPIAQGKQVYYGRMGDTRGPNISEIVIDPFDPKIGENQLWQVSVSDTHEVASASVTLKTDNGNQTHQLSLSDTDKNKWLGVWKTSDTHNYIYSADINVNDNSDESKAELNFR